MRTVTVVAVCIMLAAAAGIVLAAVISKQLDQLHTNMIRCWGWYEGTYGGRQGAPCPAWWPPR